jgi:hypothetical protein
MSDQLVWRHNRTGLERYESFRNLSEHFVEERDNSSLGNCGMPVQGFLNVCRINVLTARKT